MKGFKILPHEAWLEAFLERGIQIRDTLTMLEKPDNYPTKNRDDLSYIFQISHFINYIFMTKWITLCYYEFLVTDYVERRNE